MWAISKPNPARQPMLTIDRKGHEETPYRQDRTVPGGVRLAHSSRAHARPPGPLRGHFAGYGRAQHANDTAACHEDDIAGPKETRSGRRRCDCHAPSGAESSERQGHGHNTSRNAGQDGREARERVNSERAPGGVAYQSRATTRPAASSSGSACTTICPRGPSDNTSTSGRSQHAAALSAAPQPRRRPCALDGGSGNRFARLARPRTVIPPRPALSFLVLLA